MNKPTQIIEHGSGLGIDPSGDEPIDPTWKSPVKAKSEPTGTDPIRIPSVDGNHGGITDGHKVIDDGMVSIHTHGARVGEMHVIAASSPNSGKSILNDEGYRDINSQPERFYAKASGAFLSEGVRE